MTVGVKRQNDARVAEPFTDDLGVYLCRQKQRGAIVTQTVQVQRLVLRRSRVRVESGRVVEKIPIVGRAAWRNLVASSGTGGSAVSESLRVLVGIVNSL